MDQVDALFAGLTAPPLCSRCGERPRRSSHPWCAFCHAAYMRQWRRAHTLTPEGRRKDIARSKAGVYLRRGKITRQNCPCGSPESEMHHPDYDRPYDVEWLCRSCHLATHRVKSTA